MVSEECNNCGWKKEMRKHLKSNWFYGIKKIYEGECEHCSLNQFGTPVVRRSWRKIDGR